MHVIHCVYRYEIRSAEALGRQRPVQLALLHPLWRREKRDSNWLMCPSWQKELREENGIYFQVCLTLNFLLSPSHFLHPPCVVSPQWVMAFFLMVCNVSFLRLLLPITNLQDRLHRRKENTEIAYICIWMRGWQTTMGGGNKMCSMNFAIFALRELEEFTEPSVWR